MRAAASTTNRRRSKRIFIKLRPPSRAREQEFHAKCSRISAQQIESILLRHVRTVSPEQTADVHFAAAEFANADIAILENVHLQIGRGKNISRVGFQTKPAPADFRLDAIDDRSRETPSD